MSETRQTRPDADEHDRPPILELDGVTRSFGPETAVDSLSFDVRDGELLTLLGPSGCGKSTTLRLIAGLERPDDGRVRVRGDVVADDGTFVRPENRDIGLLFQDFALFPHLSVGENVAYGIANRPDEAVERRVSDLLDLVGLADYADAAPDTLSGGQKQRVALARSLAPEPDVILLDEPFSNLDVSLRREMREEVRRILKETGVTAISVTHDQEEALSISDRVAVMNDGHLEQVGRPETVFEQPTSRFVAEFIGEAGFVSGRFADGRVETPVGDVPADAIAGLDAEYEGADIDVLVRPDDLRAVPTDDGNGRVVHRQYTGPAFVYRVELDTGGLVYCEHNHADQLSLDRRVRVDLDIDHRLAWFPTEE
ncbi:ABC transporter ATP-binding protein [Salarchaeum japonicum]|uniref:Molybdate/tungstate import ATP-binding protein WtpC n=1 Tax=Salarchaeum japonicum TaxID=555573 RepID=A0AAV3T447_9EURY|nr:ABC transporter ATP-binding protein [Salarchaeum japonicum]